MAKAKTRVRRLALAPSFDPGETEDAEDQEGQVEDEQHMLHREQMARVTDISMIAGQGKHEPPHVHGVEQWQGSKLWAIGEGYSSVESDEEEDEAASPVLVQEALIAGFTIDQICQAEAELDTPPAATTKVCAKLKEGSISKQIVDVWVNNRRKQGKPWSGPLPPPRQSPPRTLGDAVAKARVVNYRKDVSMQYMNDRRRGLTLSAKSSARQRHTLSSTVTSARGKPWSDHMDMDWHNSEAMTSRGSPETERRHGPPVMSTVEPDVPSGQAVSQDIQLLKIETKGEITVVLKSNDIMGHQGRHISNISLNQVSNKPVTKYIPTPGLISLFSKTGRKHRNPNQQPRTHAPPNQPPKPRRSYADVLRAGMDGKGAPMQGNSSGNGNRGNGSGGYRGHSPTFLPGEDINDHIRGIYGAGYHGSPGGSGFQGGRGYIPRGRGYGGPNRQFDSRGYKAKLEAIMWITVLIVIAA
jgi:hypothetical protein